MQTVHEGMRTAAHSASNPRKQSGWLSASIVGGSALFMFGLLVSAVFAPEWRLLHALQMLIYVGVIVLTRRNSAWGFGVGFFVAAFWNVLALLGTPMFQDAFREIGELIRTGTVERPDLLLSLLAAIGHSLVIVGCLSGFLRITPSRRQWVQFVAGGLLVIGYLFAIVIAFAPPEGVALFRRVFGL